MRRVATSPNNEDPGALSSRIFRCSVVMPDGPPAAPLREFRRFSSKRSMSKLRGTVGSTSATNGSSGSLTPRSRLSSSVHAFHVFSVPGAKASPSRAWRAVRQLSHVHKTQCSSRPRLDGVLFAATSSASCQRSVQQSQPIACVEHGHPLLHPCLRHQSSSWRSEQQQPGKQEEELLTTNILHAVFPGATLQNLLQSHLQTSPEHAFHEIGDGLHDLCSHFENLTQIHFV